MTENKRNKEKKKSVIVGLLRKFKNAFYAKATVGFFGRRSASFDKANKKLDGSFAAAVLGKQSKLGKAVAKSRFFVADQFENSLSLYLWRKLLRFLVGCRIRLYGAFFASFGVSVLIGYLAKRFIFSDPGAEIWRIALAASLILASLPMIFTRKTLSEALGESLLGRFISQKTLGISENKFDVSAVKHGNAYNFSVILGVAVGVLSLFIEPLILLISPLVILGTAIVLYSPEAGVVITFIELPFVVLFGSDAVLLWSVALFSASYLIKLVRGKRIMRFEITDLFLMLFAFAIVCGGIQSNSDTAKDVLSPLLVMFGAFVVGNLMRTKLWHKRFIASYIFAASVIAVVTVLEFAFSGELSLSAVFGGYAFAADTDMAATFMLPALFASITFAVYSATVKEKIASTLVSLLLAFAIAVTDAAVGYPLIIGLVILFLILKRETVSAVVVGIFAVPVTLTLIPWSFSKTIGRAFDLSSVLNYQSSKVFQGTFRMTSHFWFSGIGHGNFETIYPYFAASGFERASRLPSTFLKLYENYGIVGVLLILTVFALFFINCFGFISSAGGMRTQKIVAAGVSAVICLLFKSVFFNTFGDLKLLFVIFSVFYVTCAAARNGRQEIEKNNITYENSEFSASVEI